MSDEAVDAALAGVVAARAQLDELGLRLLAAASLRELGGRAGSASMATWWAGRAGRTRAAAAADVRLATALHAEEHELTAAALAAGVLSVEQADVISRTLTKLPASPAVSYEQRGDAEAFLVSQGAGADGSRRLQQCTDVGATAPVQIVAGPLGMGPRELTRLGRRLFEVIDPDRADEQEGRLLEHEEALARRLTWLRMRPNGDGTTHGTFRLPDAQADMLRTVLEGYASPRRHQSRARSTSTCQLGVNPSRADRLAETDPACIEESSRMVPADEAGHSRYYGIHSAGFDDAAFRPGEGDTTPTTLRYDQRFGLALCELLEHVPTDRLPQSGGVAATVTVTLDHQHLLDGLGAATLSTGTPISARQARRLACGAGLVPLVLGGDSMPVDVGREQRLYDRYGRIAMGARDGGCVFPGCDRPPAWCESHHLTPWSQGGRTDVSDGCLFCAFHHHLVHQGEWEARMSPDGVAEVIPPARIDPTRIPRRHERFRAPARAPCRR